MTLGDYYKNFLGLYGGLTTTLGSIPLLPLILPKDYSRCLVPPIGPTQDILRIGLPLLAVLITFIVFQAKDSTLAKNKNRFRNILFIAIIAFVSFIVYIGLSIQYVKTIDMSPDPSITVSVGSTRSEIVLNHPDEKRREEFARMSDEQLLQSQRADGLHVEESVSVLWTSYSIWWVRFGLFLSYIFCFLPFIGIGSFLILFDLLNKTPLFNKSDFKNISSFISKLKDQQDTVSSYLYKQLSPETQELIGEFIPSKTPPDELVDKLIADLNKFIEGCSFSNLQNQFTHIDLSKTRKLEKQLQIRRNRTILEDAYPTEIQSYNN